VVAGALTVELDSQNQKYTQANSNTIFFTHRLPRPPAHDYAQDSGASPGWETHHTPQSLTLHTHALGAEAACGRSKHACPASGLHPRPASKTAPPSVVLGPCQTIDSFPVLASQTARTICSPPEATSCALTADSCMSSSWHSRTHSCGARVQVARLGHTPYRLLHPLVHVARGRPALPDPLLPALLPALLPLTTPPWLPAARGCAAQPPSSPGHSRQARATSRGRWRPQSRAPPERGAYTANGPPTGHSPPAHQPTHPPTHQEIRSSLASRPRGGFWPPAHSAGPLAQGHRGDIWPGARCRRAGLVCSVELVAHPLERRAHLGRLRQDEPQRPR
jgi:hypothetical protein